jgi:hypothetical protein
METELVPGMADDQDRLACRKLDGGRITAGRWIRGTQSL